MENTKEFMNGKKKELREKLNSISDSFKAGRAENVKKIEALKKELEKPVNNLKFWICLSFLPIIFFGSVVILTEMDLIDWSAAESFYLTSCFIIILASLIMGAIIKRKQAKLGILKEIAENYSWCDDDLQKIHNEFTKWKEYLSEFQEGVVTITVATGTKTSVHGLPIGNTKWKESSSKQSIDDSNEDGHAERLTSGKNYLESRIKKVEDFLKNPLPDPWD